MSRSSDGSIRLALVIRWTAAGLLASPLTMRAAIEGGNPVGGGVFAGLLVAVGLVLGLGIWWVFSAKARRSLRQAELQVKAILAHADCVVWRAKVVRRSQGYAWDHFDMPKTQLSDLLFGDRVYSPECGFWETLTMPDQAEMDQLSSQALARGFTDYGQQFRAITRSGREFWLNEKVTLNQTGDGIWELVGVITDITAQKKAEESAKRSELQLAQLLERADTMLWQARVERRADGTMNWVMFVPKSQVYRKIFSEDPQNPIGFAWDRKGVLEAQAMSERAASALSDGLPGYEQNIHVPLPSGSIWLSESVTITPVGPGTWELVGIITDITARHEAEKAWEQSELKLGKLLELADCMVWEASVTLLPDKSLDWNLQTQPSILYRRIFGDAPLKRAGLHWHTLAVPEYDAMAARVLDAVLHRRAGYSQEFQVPLPDGTIWLREVVTMKPSGDDSMHLVGVITDVTAVHQAVSALEASEHRLETLLERADCMIWQGEVTRDAADEFTWRVFTPRSNLFRRLFDHDPDGTCHFAWDNGSVPDIDEIRTRARQAMTQNLPGYEQVFCFDHAERGRIWLSERVGIKSHGPDRWELAGVITDITAQQEADASRKATELRLQEILARADCLLWEAEVDSQVWSWDFHVQPSGLGSKLYGSGQHEARHRLWHFFNIPERSEMDLRSRTAMLAGERGYAQVFHIIREGFPDIWLRESVSIGRLSDTRYSLVGVAVDISLQRTAEAALAAEKERLAVTLRAMSESVISTDVNGRIHFMNPAAATLTGWPAEGSIGRQVQLVCPLVNNHHEHPMEVMVGRVAQSDRVIEFPDQTWLVNREGKRLLIEGCCAPIHAADNKLLGTVLVLRDITEQNRLEQELMRATRLESVGVLAGGIAHDFNNILTAVMGNLTLAQLDLPAGSPVTASLQSAEKAALRARDLTQQLLTFARGGEPVRAAVQLDVIIREVTGFALHGSSVRPHYDMAPDLWLADADKGQIGRVVQNIVINSVQAMPTGGTLQIVVRNDPQSSSTQPGLLPADYILIAISDTGEGIKAEDLSKIFDPYFTTKASGTGLGLAAVYSIVKKHRGHIEVDSTLGKGTTFRIWLPAARDSRAAQALPNPHPQQSTVLLRGRVLFMDDEPSIREMAEILLRRFGLAVTSVADGAGAVAAYEAAMRSASRYDLVIMDLTVPGGMGGLAALGRLRAIDPAVRAVVSSGYSSDPVMAHYRTHGFVARIAKPYESHELAHVLRELLPAE